MADGKSKLDITKDVLSITKEVVVIVLLLCVVFFPELTKRKLVAYGIKSLEFGGVKADITQKLAEETGDALQKTEIVKQELDSMKTSLNAIIPQITNPELKQEALALESQITKSIQTTQSTEKDLRQNLKAQEAIMEELPASDANWGIIISADKKAAEAKFEVKRATGLGYSAIFIYKKGGFFRTVVDFTSREQAQDSLPAIRRKLRANSYMVNLDQWCPRSNTTPDGIIECR